MGMPAPQPVTTIEDLLALPEDGLRHELLDGEHVVTPSPRRRHQDVLLRLFMAVNAALREHPELAVYPVDADIRLGPRTLVQPDLFIVPRAEVEWADTPPPLLAAEVLSSSTAARDRGKKRQLYLEAGVEEYWIVDADARLVERWRQGDERPEILHDTLDWHLSTGASGSVGLRALFIT